MKYDLSILIPARNEMFLAKTVEDILKNKRGKTEIIVHLDGDWADPGIPDHPDVTIIYSPEAIGQRAGTNKACRLSKAKYVMKADAHLSFDEGFDVKLMEKITDDMTIVPMMRNLHVFNWVCIGNNPKSGKLYIDPDIDKDIYAGCGYNFYQGPTPDKCRNCSGNMERQLIWKAKESPRSTAFTFDKTLHFQYFNEFKKRPEGKGELTETMSLQGSCFMLTRQKYWELDICDENYGSWGQQGTEVACKTWLSGGRVMCLQTTWYAHMFRTQGGDFSFPYPQSGKQISHARKYSREQFEKGKWDKAIHDLDWLLDRFFPVPEWHTDKQGKKEAMRMIKGESKGIVFYTDNKVTLKIAHNVQKNLKRIGLPIVSASLKPMPHFGKNIHILLERGYLTMFKQQLAALEASDADIVYMCEHDVLYHPSHFDFTPLRKDVFYYNINLWKVDAYNGHALWVDVCQQVSGLVAYRELLIEEYKKRINRLEREGHFERGWGFEPGTKSIRRGGFSDYTAENFKSKYPNLDIRAEHNLTPNRWSKEQFRNQQNTFGWKESHIANIKGWDGADEVSYIKPL